MKIDAPHMGIQKALLVAGASKHSVSTAVGVLNADNHYRVLYEPFNQWFFSCLWGLRYPSYLRRDGASAQVTALADRIFAGRVRRAEIDRTVDDRTARTDARDLLVRECRVNLWLDFFRARYPNMPIVLVLRHPCAVVASRLLLDWTPQLRRQLVLKDIIRDHLQPFMPEIAKAEAAFEQHAFMWAIHHYVPLRQFRRGEIHLTYYESLVTKPETVESMCHYAGRSFHAALLGDNEPRQEKRKVLDVWRRQLSSFQVRRIIEILKLFGLDAIYSTETFPNELGVERLLHPA